MYFFQRLRKTVPTYNFHRLGFGFDPVKEEVKVVNLLNTDHIRYKEVLIENSKFKVPDSVDVFVINSRVLSKLSHITKREYEIKKALTYGLDADVKLVVNTSGDGKWLNDGYSIRQYKTVSLSYEQIIANFMLLNPKMHINHPVFMEALKTLPTRLTDETSAVFLKFFETYGTHTIIEQNIGGWVQYDATILDNTLSENNLLDKTNAIYQIISSTNAKKESRNITEQLKQEGISALSVRFEGGLSPSNVLSGTFNQELFLNWSNTISKSPVELNRAMRLHPHYLLLDDDDTLRYRALNEATRQYLCGQLSRISIEEPKASKFLQDGFKENNNTFAASLGLCIAVNFGLFYFVSPLVYFPNGCLIIL